jgi:hypothetical protein
VPWIEGELVKSQEGFTVKPGEEEQP